MKLEQIMARIKIKKIVVYVVFSFLCILIVRSLFFPPKPQEITDIATSQKILGELIEARLIDDTSVIKKYKGTILTLPGLISLRFSKCGSYIAKADNKMPFNEYAHTSATFNIVTSNGQYEIEQLPLFIDPDLYNRLSDGSSELWVYPIMRLEAYYIDDPKIHLGTGGPLVLKIIDLSDAKHDLDYDHLIIYRIQDLIKDMMTTYARALFNWRKGAVDEIKIYLNKKLSVINKLYLDIDFKVDLISGDGRDEYVVTAFTRKGRPIISYNSKSVSKKGGRISIDHYNYYDNWYEKNRRNKMSRGFIRC